MKSSHGLAQLSGLCLSILDKSALRMMCVLYYQAGLPNILGGTGQFRKVETGAWLERNRPCSSSRRGPSRFARKYKRTALRWQWFPY
ncbi:hypothetical protein BJY00DRAFT_295453 [Aspergillus carlsbadensis]|nr:hypothetical protein BJY00DRAFT_295453 [Aspergillus carlsbadensis]